MGHSHCILSTFEVHSKYFSIHSGSILTTFLQHSTLRGTSTFQSSMRRFIRPAIQLQSYGFRSAFRTLWQHSEYSYWVPTIFELHSSNNTLGICKNHLMHVRSEFVVFERHSIKNDIPTQMWIKFENC